MHCLVTSLAELATRKTIMDTSINHAFFAIGFVGEKPAYDRHI